MSRELNVTISCHRKNCHNEIHNPSQSKNEQCPEAGDELLILEGLVNEQESIK